MPALRPVLRVARAMVSTFTAEIIEKAAADILACFPPDEHLNEVKARQVLGDLDENFLLESKVPTSWQEEGSLLDHWKKVSAFVNSLQKSMLTTAAVGDGDGRETAKAGGSLAASSYSPLVEAGGVKVSLFDHVPPVPKKHGECHSYVCGLCPDIAEKLTKTMPLVGGRAFRQDFQHLTELQIVSSLVRPLEKIGTVTQMPRNEYQERVRQETAFANDKKRKAETVGNLGETLDFLSKMARIEGNDPEEEVRFRNLATSSFALSQRVAAAGLREAREDVMATPEK